MQKKFILSTMQILATAAIIPFSSAIADHTDNATDPIHTQNPQDNANKENVSMQLNTANTTSQTNTDNTTEPKIKCMLGAKVRAGKSDCGGANSSCAGSNGANQEDAWVYATQSDCNKLMTNNTNDLSNPKLKDKVVTDTLTVDENRSNNMYSENDSVNSSNFANSGVNVQ